MVSTVYEGVSRRMIENFAKLNTEQQNSNTLDIDRIPTEEMLIKINAEDRKVAEVVYQQIMIENFAKLNTEQQNSNTLDIDRIPTEEMLIKINAEDRKVAEVVYQQIPAIAKLIDQAYACVENGGRILYVGAGTSGRLINAEDRKVAEVVYQQIPAIAKLIDQAYACVENGGRILYVGAGTSGRLGILDASECPPTYGVSDQLVQGVIAGGTPAIFKAQEGAEDSKELAIEDLKERELSSADMVIGLAASGRTPYVIGALEYANQIGAQTGSVCCVEHSELAKVVYVGAGTSGRLGILDASECPPTYGVSDQLVQGVIAGGTPAIFKAQEGAEDSKELAIEDLKERELSSADMVIGLAASGRTPYVIGALEYANQIGAQTGSVCCVEHSELAKVAHDPVEVVTGAEVVTGSTRMKAGTAQKMVLNMISTCVMIKMGKVYHNLMVDVQPSNDTHESGNGAKDGPQHD